MKMRTDAYFVVHNQQVMCEITSVFYMDCYGFNSIDKKIIHEVKMKINNYKSIFI